MRRLRRQQHQHQHQHQERQPQRAAAEHDAAQTPDDDDNPASATSSSLLPMVFHGEGWMGAATAVELAAQTSMQEDTAVFRVAGVVLDNVPFANAAEETRSAPGASRRFRALSRALGELPPNTPVVFRVTPLGTAHGDTPPRGAGSTGRRPWRSDYVRAAHRLVSSGRMQRVYVVFDPGRDDTLLIPLLSW